MRTRDEQSSVQMTEVYEHCKRAEGIGNSVQGCARRQQRTGIWRFVCVLLDRQCLCVMRSVKWNHIARSSCSFCALGRVVVFAAVCVCIKCCIRFCCWAIYTKQSIAAWSHLLAWIWFALRWWRRWWWHQCTTVAVATTDTTRACARARIELHSRQIRRCRCHVLRGRRSGRCGLH